MDLSIAHDRFGSSSHVQQNGCLSHPQDLDTPLPIGNNTLTIRTFLFSQRSFSTSIRMHGEFLCLLFLQAHRETEAHFTAAGMSSQTNNSEAFRFKRAAFYNGLKSKVIKSDWRRPRQQRCGSTSMSKAVDDHPFIDLTETKFSSTA